MQGVKKNYFEVEQRLERWQNHERLLMFFLCKLYNSGYSKHLWNLGTKGRDNLEKTFFKYFQIFWKKASNPIQWKSKNMNVWIWLLDVISTLIFKWYKVCKMTEMLLLSARKWWWDPKVRRKLRLSDYTLNRRWN